MKKKSFGSKKQSYTTSKKKIYFIFLHTPHTFLRIGMFRYVNGTAWHYVKGKEQRGKRRKFIFYSFSSSVFFLLLSPRPYFVFFLCLPTTAGEISPQPPPPPKRHYILSLLLLFPCIAKRVSSSSRFLCENFHTSLAFFLSSDIIPIPER